MISKNTNTAPATPTMVESSRHPSSWKCVGELNNDGRHLGFIMKTDNADQYAIVVPREYGRRGEITHISSRFYAGSDFRRVGGLRLSSTRRVSYYELIA